MIPEFIVLSNLRSRSPNDEIVDRLLADAGITRAELKKQNSWFRRKVR